MPHTAHGPTGKNIPARVHMAQEHTHVSFKTNEIPPTLSSNTYLIRRHLACNPSTAKALATRHSVPGSYQRTGNEVIVQVALPELPSCLATWHTVLCRIALSDHLAQICFSLSICTCARHDAFAHKRHPYHTRMLFGSAAIYAVRDSAPDLARGRPRRRYLRRQSTSLLL